MAVMTDQMMRTRVLEQTIAVIEKDGEQAVRVVDIAKHVGVAVTTLFHLFGTRETLVATAQVERYVRSLGSSIEELDVATALAQGLEDFRGLIIRFVRNLLGSSEQGSRRSRLAVAGTAAGDRALATNIGNAHHSLCLGLSVVLDRARTEKWIEPSLEPLSTAHWMIETLFARAFNEVGEQSFDRRAWDDLALRSVLRTLFND